MLERLLGLQDENLTDKETAIVTQHSIEEENKHDIHILLVEDNPINLKLAKFLLTKAGYKLSTVTDGQQAVDTFCSQPEKFDLILMDIQMPVVDGLKATKIIRERGFDKIPIIAMTAEAMKGDREKCLAAGMNDYIAKPIKRDIVFKIVRQWCL